MESLILPHVIISLIGIATGFIVMYGMLTSNRMPSMTAVFLVTTIVTSASGFVLPAPHFLPSHAVGILSLIVLAIAVYAYYPHKLAGAWRWIYVVTALVAQFFNCFVGVVQAFKHVPSLHDFATGDNPPPLAPLALLVAFVVIGILTLKKFHPANSAAIAAV
ncbi:hypothetical protein BH10PLA1_BH10PLA1_10350 [soil metagenome]